MKRVVVIGPFFYELIMDFGKDLSEKTGIPLYDLCEIFKVDVDSDLTDIFYIFLEREKKLVSKPTWIIVGDDTLEICLDRCDTVVFLDYPKELTSEILDARLNSNEVDSRWYGIVKYYYSYRAEVVKKLEKCSNLNIIILKNEEEKEEFLKKL